MFCTYNMARASVQFRGNIEFSILNTSFLFAV
nr:MAG TPA: hypothetical protein [Caudoviricetes sp.]DAN30843.1 MAG TPA: hypothetical protein [Caudoviricetes sp.]